MPDQNPLRYVFYIAVPPQKVWDGFTSQESNRTLFIGAEFEADWTPGGTVRWFGKGLDEEIVPFVRGQVLQADAPKLLQYTFATGSSDKFSRVTIELLPETEATKVTVTHDQWAEDDNSYSTSAEGWPRILSRMKTLLETGKTFKPH
jgi:uncharacterized protein YndB with AHSA1/START domain